MIRWIAILVSVVGLMTACDHDRTEQLEAVCDKVCGCQAGNEEACAEECPALVVDISEGCATCVLRQTSCSEIDNCQDVCGIEEPGVFGDACNALCACGSELCGESCVPTLESIGEACASCIAGLDSCELTPCEGVCTVDQ
jgi:hypothetical protein